MNYLRMKKTNNLIFPLLVMGVFLIFASSCKKNDDNNGGNNAGIPVLSTTAITDITQTTAKSGGIFTSDGGATVTARGVCWSTNQTPTTSDNKTIDGTGAGNFVSSISGLTANTTYYVRAYATNNNGTSYGSAMSFTTQGGSANTFTDIRDGNVYQTVTIGNQIWMAENLKYLPSVVGPGTGSQTLPNYYVYGYSGTTVADAKFTANYTTYGVLYNWTAACNSCPAGWHLPSDAEWTKLTDFVGGSSNSGTKLKSTSGWISGGNGRDEYGFTALPGGGRGIFGTFDYVGLVGSWWSASEFSTDYAWYHYVSYNYSNVSRLNYYKALGLSVRCVRD